MWQQSIFSKSSNHGIRPCLGVIASSAKSNDTDPKDPVRTSQMALQIFAQGHWSWLPVARQNHYTEAFSILRHGCSKSVVRSVWRPSELLAAWREWDWFGSCHRCQLRWHISGNNLASVPYMHLFHNIIEHSLNFWNIFRWTHQAIFVYIFQLEATGIYLLNSFFSRRGEISLRAVAQQVLCNSAALDEFIYAMFPVLQLWQAGSHAAYPLCKSGVYIVHKVFFT